MKRLHGFTLIELLIVVAIIGILAAIAVPNFLNAQVRAKVAKAESEMRSLQNALESFYIDNNSYPPLSNDRTLLATQYKGLDAKNPSAFIIDISHILIGSRNSGRRFYLTTPIAYITTFPSDPFRGDGKEAGYGYGSNGQSYYILTSWGPDGGDGLAGVKGGELYECDYTGAQLNDFRRVAVRKSPYKLSQLRYEPSNGTTSTGDIIRVN